MSDFFDLVSRELSHMWGEHVYGMIVKMKRVINF